MSEDEEKYVEKMAAGNKMSMWQWVEFFAKLLIVAMLGGGLWVAVSKYYEKGDRSQGDSSGVPSEAIESNKSKAE